MIKQHKYTFAIAIILIILLNLLGLFEALNEKIYDNYILLNQSKTYNKELVLITIDDNCINKFGHWPFNRLIHSKVLKKLLKTKPSVIGINLSFTEKNDPNEDQELYEILRSFSPLTLALYVEIKSFSNTSGTKVPVFFRSNKTIFPDIAHSHSYIQHSDKGTVREFKPFITLGGKKYNAFAVDIVKLYYKSNNKNISKELQTLFINDKKSKEILIDYKRPVNLFKQYSYLDILNNKVPLEKLQNKILLIGLTDQNLTSKYVTPFTGTQSLFSTPLELQAQIIDSLLNYRGLVSIPNWLIIFISIVISLIYLYLIKNKAAIIQGLLFVLFILIVSILDFILFKHLALWLAPALPLTLISFIFGLSIYFTTTSVDKELINTIKSFKITDLFPFTEVPNDITSKVGTLKYLLEVIHEDRNTINSILQGVNNGIIVFDSDGLIIWANAKMLELIKDSLVLNINVKDLLETDNIENITETINKNSFYKTDVIINQFEFLCIINKIKSKKEHYVAILNDITELKQIDRLKTDMVRMVSHELKNPLAAILLNAENITFIKDTKIIEDSAENIIATAELLLETINNFLNISRLEANMVEMNIKPDNLIDVLDQSINIQSAIAKEKNVVIVYEKIDLPPVLIDNKHILIVINNFISNAIKYSNTDSKVVIDTIIDNRYVKVSVTDSGIGIPEDDIEKVFDKFYRSRNNKEKNIEGTGLGLSIVSKIIDIHGGKLDVISEYGKGSTFSFSVPVAK
ncbi:MAG: CHASE2 domain-containing protein [Cyanobacteriota bacterium]